MARPIITVQPVVTILGRSIVGGGTKQDAVECTGKRS
jgi:hypothetical protein